MVNENYEPTDAEDDVLEVLRDEWRANPYLIRERTDFGKGTVNTALSNLTSAGWVDKVTRGLYEFVDDPREDSAKSGTESGESTPERPSEGDVDTNSALYGWTHGRGEKEKTASRAIAVESLEWLAEYPGAAKKSDVPLDELAASDDLGRHVDTLWTEVIRSAWQHACERGFIRQPKSRSYEWVGDGE